MAREPETRTAADIPDTSDEPAAGAAAGHSSAAASTADAAHDDRAEHAERARKARGIAARFNAGAALLAVGIALSAAGLAYSLPLPVFYAGITGAVSVAGLVLVSVAFGQARKVEGPAIHAAYEDGLAQGAVLAQAAAQPPCPATTGADDEQLHQAAEVAARSETAPADPAEGLLSHSDDLFATLRSLVDNDHAASGYQGLRALLAGIGLDGWDTAPRTVCRLLGRNGSYWIAAETEGLPTDDYDRLMATEAALNLARAVHAADGNPDPVRFPERARIRLRTAYRLSPFNRNLEDYLRHGYPDPAAALPKSEWAFRIGVADALENAPTPFRLNYDMRSDAGSGLMLVRLEVPRPAAFAALSDDAAERRELARSYALRTAVLAVAAGFRVPQATRVAVSCHEHDSRRTVLSVDADRAVLARLQQKAGSEPGWFDDPAVRVRLDDGGWLAAIEPHVRETASVFTPDLYVLPPELDQRECSPALAAVSHARTASDFGINEDAERRWVWDRFTDDAPAATTSEAVNRLMALRDESVRPETAAACEAAIRALAEGTVEPTDRAALRRLVFGAGPLEEAVQAANTVMGGRDPKALAPALEQLQAALSAGVQISYLDDTDTVYRYFGSAAERVAFNRAFADDGRAVQLVPDAYYNALELCARMLVLAGRSDEAASYADEALRIAPMSADAVIVKVRVLEAGRDPFAAADVLREALGRALSVRDVALLLYRLAFFEWKLGQGTLAVACYKAVFDLRTSLSPQAMELARSIIVQGEALDVPLERAHELLRQEGIAYEVAPATREWINACAILCTDEHFYPAAASLSGSLVEIMHDDALADVCKSLLARTAF